MATTTTKPVLTWINSGLIFYVVLSVCHIQSIHSDKFMLTDGGFKEVQDANGQSLCSFDPPSASMKADSLCECESHCMRFSKAKCSHMNFDLSSGMCNIYGFIPNCFKKSEGCVDYQKTDVKMPSGPNIALKKPAGQSSLYQIGNWKNLFASAAVDGNDDPYLNSTQPCSHTLDEPKIKSWWYVDLGKVTNVTHVKIRNRSTRAERLSDFIVGTTNTTPSGEGPLMTSNHSICAYWPCGVDASAKITIHCRPDVLPGRFLFIQHVKPAKHLTLCEVEVYA